MAMGGLIPSKVHKLFRIGRNSSTSSSQFVSLNIVMASSSVSNGIIVLSPYTINVSYKRVAVVFRMYFLRLQSNILNRPNALLQTSLCTCKLIMLIF